MLSPEQIDRLFAAPGQTDPWWRRDRALLELLYATGCRASELSRLRLCDMHLDEGFCICRGKGDKERLVPLGGRAVEAVRAYLEHERQKLAARRRPPADWTLLSYRGRRLRRERIWELLKRYVRRVGAPPEVSPHTSATVSPRICWPAGPICARCRRCSATPASPPRKSTPTSI